MTIEEQLAPPRHFLDSVCTLPLGEAESRGDTFPHIGLSRGSGPGEPVILESTARR